MNREENLQKIHKVELVSAEAQLDKITSSFKIEHAKKLEYLGLIHTSIASSQQPHSINNFQGVKSQEFDIEHHLNLEKPLLIFPKKSLGKRKRSVFEDSSQARILNDDERLKALESHLLKKKKSNDVSLVPKQQKTKIILPKKKTELSKKESFKTKENNSVESETLSSQGFEDSDDSEILHLRGFHSSLANDIKGLSQFDSNEDCETANTFVHSLYLPFSIKTEWLSCKKNIVNNLIFYSSIIFLGNSINNNLNKSKTLN